MAANSTKAQVLKGLGPEAKEFATQLLEAFSFEEDPHRLMLVRQCALQLQLPLPCSPPGDRYLHPVCFVSAARRRLVRSVRHTGCGWLARRPDNLQHLENETWLAYAPACAPYGAAAG